MPRYSFPAVVQSLCSKNSRVLILAIGLSESDPFPELGRSVGGRFMPVGIVNDPDLIELYYLAADIYMDAYPFGSLTAVLDAARHGVPTQRLCVPNQSSCGPDAAALDSVMQGGLQPGRIRWKCPRMAGVAGGKKIGTRRAVLEMPYYETTVAPRGNANGLIQPSLH